VVVMKSSTFWDITLCSHWKSTNISEECAGSACYLLHASFLICLLFDPEDGDDMFLQNTGWLSVDYSVISQNTGNQSCFLYISCVFIILHFLSKNNTINWIMNILISIWHNVCVVSCTHSFVHLQTHPLNHSHSHAHICSLVQDIYLPVQAIVSWWNQT
jgi:hypothetical protein